MQKEIPSTLIKQGAEARIYKTTFLGKPTIIKERFSKSYRHPVLDQRITKSRIAQEARAIDKCKKLGIDVPALYFVDQTYFRLFMEFVEGCTVKDFFNNSSTQEKDALEIAKQIGKIIAIMHDANLVHGDLTTSNMILRNSDKSKLCMIDFGLSYESTKIEDFAVDLYVMERAMLSTHPQSEKLFSSLLEGYLHHSKRGRQTLNQLEKVRARGRKRTMVG